MKNYLLEYTYELSEISQIAASLWEQFKDHRIWLFYGQVGAGKTTFIKQICSYLEVKDNTQSPSYSLINEYQANIDDRTNLIYHIDLYRLEDVEEALNIDVESFLEGDHHCFIEWPEIIEPLLPEDCLRLSFDVVDFNHRKIKLS